MTSPDDLTLAHLTEELAPARQGKPAVTRKTWRSETRKAVAVAHNAPQPVPTEAPPYWALDGAYSPLPVVSLPSGVIKVNPSDGFVDIEGHLEGPATNTCFFDLSANNDTALQDFPTWGWGEYWGLATRERIRPGDEPRFVVRVNFSKPQHGHRFSVGLTGEAGCRKGNAIVYVEFDNAAPKRSPILAPKRRAAAVPVKTGSPTFELKKAPRTANSTGRDSTGKGIWQTQAAYGNDANNAEAAGYGPNPVRFNPDGSLVLQAFFGLPMTSQTGRTYPHQAAMITTRNFFSQLYGYWESDVLCENKDGTWPADWLLPSNGQWPPEIDKFEIMWERGFAFTQHANGGEAGIGDKSIDPWARHRHGLDWREDLVTWFVDDVEVFQCENWFHLPAFILLDIALGDRGGALPAPGSPNAWTRCDMTVFDYRVWV